jgi:hypothetical protein
MVAVVGPLVAVVGTSMSARQGRANSAARPHSATSRGSSASKRAPLAAGRPRDSAEC